MTPELLTELRANTATLIQRWEALLRVERVTGPLANPDSLVHLIPDSLPKIFAALTRPTKGTMSFAHATAERLPACNCGNNPFLAYFVAGEQALVETVVLLQAKLPPSGNTESDVAKAILAMRALARNEIDTFCGVCTHRGCLNGCRFPADADAAGSCSPAHAATRR